MPGKVDRDMISFLKALTTMADRNDIIKDTHGNLSQLSEDGTEVLIKPSGMPYNEISSGDVCRFDLKTGYRLDKGRRNPSVDLPHHLSIIRRHLGNNVRAVCHTHSPYATAFAMVHEEIECGCTEQADYFGGQIRCLPYRDLDIWGDDVILHEGERAILLGRHGALTFGRDAEHAVDLAIALENVAMKTFLARNIVGKRVVPLHDEVITRWWDRYNMRYGQ